MKLYTVYDSELKLWNLPFPAQTDKHAKRAFLSDAARFTFPENFTLFRVGSWNFDEGCLATETVEICNLHDLLEAKA